MKFNLVSKNNIGAVISLFLVILLSQAKVFNFLLDTALGRAILILFILVISYTNKILGVVSVLFIVIMFNNSDIGYLEGFTTPNDSTNISTKLNNVTPPTKAMISNKKATVTTMNSTPATEGFNTIDNERNIQKGKPSSSIAVNSSMNNSTSNSVEPFDGGSPLISGSILGNYGLY
jgi:hypothetical protein